ncbi:MAG: phenylalanine--tRNA ligase subunit beta [Deltaproteobacteria bacterium]|nr:phenylalanine--tRNA ligase subunit beta [Deltaproteobacteria bacterium]
MLVSLKWLRDYIDVELSPEEIAGKLTMAGLEVDSVNRISPDFSGVVVAKILSVKPHPNADKLSLCEVSTGDQTFPVVCGAKNISAGDIVPFAKVGATIPGGYTIKSSRLRGEISEGMLCSEEELGTGEDATGIMMLPDNLTLGEDLAVALDLEDVVLEISITPNRPDCLSMTGMAREIAAMTGGEVRHPDIKFEEKGENTDTLTSVKILDSNLCPRYTARLIKNIEVRPSPAWMRMRLEAVGLRAINNVVDVTNFVMMEYGQPLHAFDFRFLEEKRIVVRGATEGEEFVSLDEKTRTLSADTLMICDGAGSRPVGIAGIMGGLNSEVKDDTKDILLESAYFNPSSIRKSARSLGMGTDAAFRFERGIDPEGVVNALNRAAQLIADLSGGYICRGYIDEYPRKIETVRDIPMRPESVNRILGTQISAGEMKDILEGLEMTVRENGEGEYLVTPPTFRVDISREIDLTEEVARIHGYESIPVSLPGLSAGTGTPNDKRTLEDRIRTIFNGYGYSEVINYSFTTPTSADILGLSRDDAGRRLIKLEDPLGEEMSVMRTGLVYGLLETMRKNISAGNHDLRIFEMGTVFTDIDEELPMENERMGGLVTGSRYDRLWHFDDGLHSDFYDLKGCVENLFDALRIRDLRFKSDCDRPFLHPGRSCHIMSGGKTIGFLGDVHPDVLDKMDIKGRMAVVFELDLRSLASLPSEEMIYRDIPKFPSISRDVAFVVDGAIEGRYILDLARKKKENLLEYMGIFDVYVGSGVPAGMKSLAVRFTYRSATRTLTDDEVNEVHDRLVERIVRHTGAKIRGMEI